MPVSLPNIMHTVEEAVTEILIAARAALILWVQSLQVDDAASRRVRHSVGAAGCIKLVKK